jgi:hypothetical protein
MEIEEHPVQKMEIEEHPVPSFGKILESKKLWFWFFE